MKFFTDRGPYLLTKISKYIKMQSKTRQKYKEILIDPGVYDLKTSDKFSWEGLIDIPFILDILPKNHYLSVDYPGDMNPQYQNLFLQKTWNNALRYCDHPQYIVTIQFRYNNYLSFIQYFDQYNRLPIESGILGIGNCCLQRGLNPFMKHALDFAFSHCRHKRIHIYGLNLSSIPYANKRAKQFNIELSVDSVKWQYFKDSKLRDQDYQIYLNKIRELGVKVDP